MRDKDVNLVKKVCEAIHNTSNLSIHITAAIAIVVYIVDYLKDKDLKSVITRVHNVTHVSPVTLTRNYNKHIMFKGTLGCA